MTRKPKSQTKRPNLFEPASEAALRAVFDCPTVEPLAIDPKAFAADPDAILIPEAYEREKALSLTLALAILLHAPQESEGIEKAMVRAIVKVMLRFSKVHPDLALRVIDIAKDANKAPFPRPAVPPGSENLVIPVVVRLSADPYFQELIFKQ